MANINNSQSNTIISGSLSNDSIINGGDNVTINALDGNDYIENSGGNNSTLNGGAGKDTIYNWGGSTVSVIGGDGNDFIRSDGNFVTIDGGADNDTIENINGSNISIVGGTGADSILNNHGNSVKVYGGEGADFLNNYGGENVTLDGGDNNDKLLNIGNNVSMSSGAGDDEILIFNDSNGVTANAGLGNDTISLESAVENILIEYTSGDGNDIIYGFKENSTLSISGGVYSTQTSDDDIIVNVGEGKITLVGAASLATVNIASESNPLFITLTEGDDTYNNTVDGATINALGGNDSIDNWNSNVSIDGSAGDDTIGNWGDNNFVNAGDGNNSIVNGGWNAEVGGVVSGFHTTIISGNGKDIIWNGADYVTISTGAGNDLIDNVHAKTSVKIDLGAGDDSLWNHASNSTIIGGEGNDTISLSSSASLNVIEYTSSDGNDLIYGLKATDTLSISGGTYSSQVSGSDIIVTVGDGKITLIGASTLSTVNIAGMNANAGKYISNTTSNTIITGSEFNDTIYNNAENATIYALDGDDSIGNHGGQHDGLDRRNLIDAGDGDDTIENHGGNSNTLIGGSGNDSVYNGNDDYTSISGGDGDDTISNLGAYVTIDGGADNDFISNDNGEQNNHHASIVGGAGDDTIHNNSGNNSTIDGNAGNDSISNSGSNVTIDSGDGDDTILNDAVNVTIYAGDGDDSIGNHGGYQSTNDLIDAGDGNDTIDNHVHDVTLKGGKGNDYIYTGDRATIYGDEGNDTIASETFNGDSVTIIGGLGDDSISLHSSGGNTLIEYNSSDGNDTIYGFNANDTLQIGGGTGTYSTQRSGDDIIVTVGDGSITLQGAATLSAFNINDTQINPRLITLTEGDDTYNNTAGETILALGGNDSIDNWNANVSIDGGAGDDTIGNWSDNNFVNAGDGNNSIVNGGWNAAVGGVVSGFHTTIISGKDQDTIWNGADYVTISSGAGNDLIDNIHAKTSVKIDLGAGDDSLRNHASNSTISGGLGDDTISLDSSASLNLIEYDSGDGNDTIWGFKTTDTLNISGGDYSIHALDSDIVIKVGNGSILLAGAATLASVNINDETVTVGDVYYALNLPDGVTVDVESNDDKCEVGGDVYYKGGAELTLTAPDGSYFKDDKLVTTETYTMPAANTTLTATDLNLYTPSTITGLNFVVDSDGNGYYEISNADEVIALSTYSRGYTNGNLNTTAGLTFKVVADIDLKGITPWKSIHNFSGTFDGGNHTISNLTTDYDCPGLFDYSYGTIKNVNLKNANITDVRGLVGVGGLVGTNYGTVKNCSVNGTINALSNGGGVVGENKGIVTDCTFSGALINNPGSRQGGLVGLNSGTINGTNTVDATTKGYSAVGGLVGENTGSGTISGTNTVIGTVSGNEKVGGLIGQNYATITADNKVDVQVKGNEDVSGLVGLTENNGALTGTNYYHSNLDSGGIGIRVYSADVDGITVSGGTPIQIGEKDFYETGTELTLTVNDGLTVKGTSNGIYTVTDHDLTDDIYYAITPPKGYEYLSGDEYNGYYRGEVTFKPKAGYLGDNITRTISELNQTLEGGTLTLDLDNHYIFKKVDETYTLATAQNVVDNNYPDLTQVYKVTVPDDMTVQGSEIYPVGETIYCKSGSTITVDGNEYTVNSDITFIKEIEAAGWTFNDGVANYRASITTISYTLNDDEVHLVSTSGGEILLAVSGIKSSAGLSLIGNVVTVGNDSLNKETVTISDGYFLQLDVDVTKSSTSHASWTFDNNVAYYTSEATSAGYLLDDNKIFYGNPPAGCL